MIRSEPGVVQRETPFRHWILDDLWSPDLLTKAAHEILTMPLSDGAWQRFDNPDERKLATSQPAAWGEAITEVMTNLLSEEFAAFLHGLTGIKGLVGKVEGGGVHRIQPGGLLQTHVDFNRASDDGMYRRLNCLVYLNKGWTEADGGALELRENADDPEPARSILPEFNTTVIFETSEKSWHGHPTPLPGPRQRISLAAYYYTAEPPEGYTAPHTTIFAEASEPV